MSYGIHWHDRDWFVMNSMNPTSRTWFSWQLSQSGNIRGTPYLKYDEPWYELSRVKNFPTVLMAWFKLIPGIDSQTRLRRVWLILCVNYFKTYTKAFERGGGLACRKLELFKFNYFIRICVIGTANLFFYFVNAKKLTNTLSKSASELTVPRLRNMNLIMSHAFVSLPFFQPNKLLYQ